MMMVMVVMLVKRHDEVLQEREGRGGDKRTYKPERAAAPRCGLSLPVVRRLRGCHFCDSPLSLSGCLLSHNDAHHGGGAVFVSAGGPGAIKSTTFVNNSAGEDGAGLYLSTGSASAAPMITVSGSSFEGNAAQGRGGGVAAQFASALALSDDDTFSGNSAAADPTTADVYYRDQVGRDDQGPR
jgi:hypothetical protein